MRQSLDIKVQVSADEYHELSEEANEQGCKHILSSITIE